jgi:hypothetical protein
MIKVTTTTTTTGTTTTDKAARAAKVATNKTEAAKLDALVQAVRTGMTQIKGLDTKATEAASLYLAAQETLNNGRVATARALAMLAKSPETFAKSGKTKGLPALSTIATMVGMPKSTLFPLWEAAQVFTAKKWERRTSAPTQAERDICAGFYADKSTTRVEQNQTKAAKDKTASVKGTSAKTLKAGTLEDVVSILDDAHKVAETFAKNHGLTSKQLDGLVAKLDMIHDVLESATAETAAKSGK